VSQLATAVLGVHTMLRNSCIKKEREGPCSRIVSFVCYSSVSCLEISLEFFLQLLLGFDELIQEVNYEFL
jgi:hypothetical protein